MIKQVERYERRDEAGELIAACSVVSQADGGGYVSSLWVAPHRRGERLGAELLDEVCADADKGRSTLTLVASAAVEDSALTQSLLEAFYARRGFEYDIRTDRWRRQPRLVPAEG